MTGATGVIFVSGGTGFLAGSVIRAALKSGFRVRALRRAEKSAPFLSAAEEGRVEWFMGDLLSPGPWREGLRGADAVLHLAAAGAGTPEMLRKANVLATQVLVEAAEREGAARLVHLSSAVVTDSDMDPYAETKRAAEAVVRGCALPWVILRPTLMVGRREPYFLNRLVERLGRRAWLPVLGRCLIQPVFVEDVARAVVSAATSAAATGGTYELAGRDVMTYEKFVCDIARASRCPSPRFLRLPLAPLQAVASVLDGVLGGHRYRRPVRFSALDHVYDVSAAERDLGFAAENWAEGLAGREPLFPPSPDRAR